MLVLVRVTSYVNNRAFEKLDHPLYVIHWVWSGNNFELKRQNIRDALKYYDDPPEYYNVTALISMDLDYPVVSLK